jgi:hypothetical protein
VKFVAAVVEKLCDETNQKSHLKNHVSEEQKVLIEGSLKTTTDY